MDWVAIVEIDACHADVSAAPSSVSRPFLRRPTLLAALAPAVLTLAVCLYELQLPNVLYGTHEYDDGVYMGAALRLVQGVIPYRDFVIVHPPGILLLMAPLAAVGRIVGSDSAMAMARDLTALVAAANVMLAAAVVRHRGWKSCLVAGTALACFPMAPAADSTLLLEPYLVLFCLVGLAVMFKDGRLASRRRMVLAGLAFGFAGTVKIWAAFVVVALALTLARRAKGSIPPLLAGAAAGFALPCLPFFVMAPGSFVTDVLGDQLQRVASGTAVMSWTERVLVLSGLPGLTVVPWSASIAVVCAAALVAFVAWAFLSRRRLLLPADGAILGCAVGAIVPMWAATDIYPHYIYFPAAFLSPLIGVAVSLALPHTFSGSEGGVDADTIRRIPRASRRPAVALLAATAVVAVFALPQQAGYARSNLTSAASPTFLNVLIGPDQCVVSDDSSILVSADIYRRPPRGCPTVVDAYGVFLASWPGHEPPSLSMGRVPVSVPQNGVPPASFVNEWADWLGRADWVLQLSQISSYIPWTPALRAWFAQDFKLAAGQNGLWAYRHVRWTPPPRSV